MERRRRFSVERKLAVLSEATAPGANMSKAGASPRVYKWRRLAELVEVIGVPGASELPSFAAVEIAQNVPSLPGPLVEAKPTARAEAPRRRRGLRSNSHPLPVSD